MPLYRFDWALGEHRVEDASGVELPDIDAAREHAVMEIRELLDTTMGKRLGKTARSRCATPRDAGYSA